MPNGLLGEYDGFPPVRAPEGARRPARSPSPFCHPPHGPRGRSHQGCTLAWACSPWEGHGHVAKLSGASTGWVEHPVAGDLTGEDASSLQAHVSVGSRPQSRQVAASKGCRSLLLHADGAAARALLHIPYETSIPPSLRPRRAHRPPLTRRSRLRGRPTLVREEYD